MIADPLGFLIVIIEVNVALVRRRQSKQERKYITKRQTQREMTIVMKCAQCQPSLSLEDFKRWLKQFDRNGDGLISKRELRAAMRSASVRYSWFKSQEGMREADANGDGLLDDDEMEKLVAFAQNRLGMKIVA